MTNTKATAPQKSLHSQTADSETGLWLLRSGPAGDVGRGAGDWWGGRAMAGFVDWVSDLF